MTYAHVPALSPWVDPLPKRALWCIEHCRDIGRLRRAGYRPRDGNLAFDEPG